MSRDLANRIGEFLRGDADYDPRALLRECREALLIYERARPTEQALRDAGFSETELAYLGYSNRGNNQ